MESRVKAMQGLILFSAANWDTSEHCNEEEIDHEEKDASNFLEETEEDSSEDNEPPKKKAKRSISFLAGKNFEWFMNPSERTFNRLNSVPNFIAKGKGAAENISSPIEAWSLLFSDDVLNIILKYTNQELEQKRSNLLTKKMYAYYEMLDMLELKALIGLLYYAGWAKQKNISINKCCSVHSLLLFQVTMPIKRLQILLSCLLFDDKTTRDERIKSDCFTDIREIWNLFITNCIQYYEPGYNVTIDEQILSFRGKCSGMRSCKRDKRGLKFVTMNDSETFYMINAIPYISNVETEPLGKIPSNYVKKISEPIHNTNRNITCSNWFTSVPIVDNMFEKFSLTMIGSLRQNNPYVPPMFKGAKKACQVAYHNNKTLISYKSENNKIIILLSSLHSDGEVNKVENKPEIVLHYNKTTGASDTFDQLCHEYSVSRATHRWSVRFFYGMLDQAAVNSFVLYTLNVNNQVITRDKFLLELSMALIKPYLIKLLSRPNLHISVQCRLKSFLDEQDLPEEDSRNLRLDISNKLSKQATCYLCPTSKSGNTRFNCLKCNNSMCRIHKASICQSCAENQFFNCLN